MSESNESSSKSNPNLTPPGGGGRVSSQMDAVLRLMSGQEARTIADKLADSNRPTWDQYKKDNEDKLNLSGLDQKKMEEYRKQLDLEREERLKGGTNRKIEKDRASDSSDSEDDKNRDRKKRRRDKKRKKSSTRKKKRKHKYSSESDYSSDSRNDDASESEVSSNEKFEENRDRKRRKKSSSRKHSYRSSKRSSSSRKKKSKSSKSRREGKGVDEDNDHFKLSKFFSKG